MIEIALIDVAPDPVTTGVGVAVAVVVMLVVAAVILSAAALVFFLWYRKRRLRHGEMIRPNGSPNFDPVQVNQPNQP
jgi:hypothetical protein